MTFDVLVATLLFAFGVGGVIGFAVGNSGPCPDCEAIEQGDDHGK